MDEVTAYVIDVLTRVEQGLFDVAPAALEMGLAVIRINAIGHLIVGFVCLVLSIILAYFGLRLFKSYSSSTKRTIYYEDSEESWKPVFGSLLGIASPIIFLAGFLPSWFNIWNWVAVFQPELALAKQLMEVIVK